MKDNVHFNHKDDVSFVTIIDDIYYEKKMKGKTVKIVVSRLGSTFGNDVILFVKLKEQYDYQKEYERYDSKFIFFDDFEKDDVYDSYKHYYYHYEFKNHTGDFRVDYKVLKDK